MTLLIAKHKFLSNIFTLRFTIAFILCEVLFVASTLILKQDYEERLEQYRTSVIQHEKSLENIYTFARLRVDLDRPPSPLSIICEGVDKRLGTSVSVAFDKAPTIAVSEGARNPLLAVFPSLDLITVIEVILSLLVIFLAYNTISGERENGTLKLTLSNNIPRHSILLGNYLGGMTSIVFPLIAGLILSLIIILTDSMIALSTADFLRILVIFIVALPFLSEFYLLSMFISSRIRHSPTVLIILLFIWVVTVAIIPNTAVYLARNIKSIPDKAEIDSKAQAIIDEWAKEMDAYSRKHPWPAREMMRKYSKDDINFLQKLNRGRSVYTGDWAYAYSYYFAPKEIIDWIYYGSIYGHILRMDYEDRVWQLYRDYQIKLNEQTNLAKIFSLFSPSWIFSHGSSLIAGTGENNYLNFLEKASDYRNELITYMKNKGGLDTYLLFTRKPVDYFPTADEIIAIKNSEGEERIREIMNYKIDPLDLSDIPNFNYAAAGIGESVLQALIEIIILIFLNIIFFSTTWVSFLRSDVR
ncbi:ABC transporter permease subunit [candidate division KSB1 bacterium]